ncbi:MAG: hypothetical protein QGG40_06125, partial [Myxococcota bacterium]|nr:hypothetical protein [Myxococcota bacterium]
SGHLGLKGEWSEETSQVLFEGTPRRLHGVGEHLLVIDTDEQLWSIPVEDGVIAGEPLFIQGDTYAVGATETPDGFAVATCGEDGGAVVAQVQAGEVAWTTSLEGDCFFDARPSIAWESDRLAVAWEQLDMGMAALLDETGTLVEQVELGEDGRYPRVVALDSGFLVADGSGQLRQFEADGTAVGTWQHPDIAHMEGNMAGLRLTVTDDLWGFALIGYDLEFTEAGHANTFYYLEVSAVPVP